MGALVGLLKFLPGVESLIKTIFGSKQERDTQTHDETSDLYKQFAAEFGPRANRTWWDSMVDGLNRLPRPLITFGLIAVMVWAPIDPEGFSIAMAAYALVPEPLWYLIFAVFIFWFGAKVLNESLPTSWKVPGPEVLKHFREMVAEREARKAQTSNWSDESKPLSDEEIKKWNAQNNPHYRP